MSNERELRELREEVQADLLYYMRREDELRDELAEVTRKRKEASGKRAEIDVRLSVLRD